MTQVNEVGFSCTSCGKQYRWKPELAGKAVKCKCGSPIRVPKQPGGAAAAPAARAAHAPPPPPPPPPPPTPKAKPARPVQEDDGMDALYALADQEAASGDEASASADSQRCPACRSKLAPDAVICMNCGFDRRKGAVVKTSVVNGDDGPPKRRLFGLLAPKKVDPSKKKVIDKMAPQGLFVVGAGVSGALAVAAGVLWAVVAYMTEYDIYYLVALVGIAAGVGMQIGQKGYSTLGGYTAAGIALLVILIARASVFFAFLLPAIKAEMAAEDALDGGAEMAYDREETKDPKTMLFDLVEEEAQREAAREAARPRAVPEKKEDPRVIEMVTEEMYRQMKIDPNFATSDQLTAAHKMAVVYAQTRPAAEKQKMIETVNARREKQELIELVWEERVEEGRKKNPNQRPPIDGAMQYAAPDVEKMSPEQQKSELARLRAKMKGIREQQEKEFETEVAQAEVEEANDGLEDADEVASADMADEDAEDGGEEADTSAASAGADASAGGAATAGGATGATGASASASASAEDDEDMSIAIGYMLALVVFGGHVRGILFLFAALGLAYCTAAGVSWE